MWVIGIKEGRLFEEWYIQCHIISVFFRTSGAAFSYLKNLCANYVKRFKYANCHLERIGGSRWFWIQSALEYERESTA